MNSILKLALASALMLSAAIGVAKAQQATDVPAPPSGAEQMDDGPDDGPDDGQEGCCPRSASDNVYGCQFAPGR